MFYANSSIKFAQVAYRGAWVALGIEFNFPVSHNWMTVSPVDFGTVTEPDGTASIWVGNIDRPYGMMWRVALTLRPGEFAARADRHPVQPERPAAPVLLVEYQLGAKSGTTRASSTRCALPPPTVMPTSTPGRSTPSGVDLSIPAHHTRGFVSRFAHGSREPFMGIYHPSTRSGIVHYSPIDEAPAKKIWSWGWDDDGRDWRRALSDNESAYLEVQAGLFRNQETYAFLEPQQFLRFHEYYMPVREIGGFSRANLHGVIHVRREPDGAGARPLRLGINVNHEILRGTLRIKEGTRVVHESEFRLAPSAAFDRVFPQLSSDTAYTVEITGPDGTVLLTHTENQYDLVPSSEIRTGPQPSYKFPAVDARSEGDVVELGKDQELNGKLLPAFETYRQGLARFPESYEINKAAGRLAVQLKRYPEAVERLLKAQGRISNDTETGYYLGHAYSGMGDAVQARAAWTGAAVVPEFRPPALLQLAQLAARDGDTLEALRQVRRALTQAPNMIRAGGLEIALLRRTGDLTGARARLAYWLALDPPNSFLRNEGVKLGVADANLWAHLAGDPERVIETAVDYIRLGFYDDALGLLERRYPSDGVFGEPGAALPQEYPLVAYYRGYCREKLGRPGREDFETASRQSTRYVFPNRPETRTVLSRALEVNPEDATAHFLLGSLYLSGGMSDAAIREWRAAMRIDPGIPVLHRNLGLALLHARSDPEGALQVLVSGIDTDPGNVDLYLGADQCMSLLGRPAQERISVLNRYPDKAGMPQALVFKLALALLEAGRGAESRRLFENRFFPREEFGTNPRQPYVEIQLQDALGLARGGSCAEALKEAEAVGKPVAGLSFTKDGMAPFVEGARFQYYLGEIADRCGNPEEARAHWRRAAETRNARQIYFGLLAARRLGEGNPQEWNGRLTAALAELDAYVAGSGHFPGAATYGQGLILRGLGRAQEGEERLRKALLLPDKSLSHYLAREALGAAGKAGRADSTRPVDRAQPAVSPIAPRL